MRQPIRALLVEEVRRGREAGMAGHFVKPVNVPTLIERIRVWIGSTPARSGR